MSTSPQGSPHPGMGMREFVGLVAALMGINALGIDAILPALPAMGHALGVTIENQRQLIIAAYVLGFGAGQILYGPLADRYGRKPVLLGAMAWFVATSLVAAFAYDFETILLARLLQGIGAAASRVLAVSMVRDCYSGRRMARVMSLAFVVFLSVPILAPSIGQLILLVLPWEGIFMVLAAFAAALALWALLRLPETLHPEYRRPISVSALGRGARIVLGNRYSLGYTIASTLLFAALMGFINSVQQIFEHVFHELTWFPLLFATIAIFMGLASFTNSRIVERLGTRLVSHSALIAFITMAAIHLAVAATGHETMWTFVALQALTMGCFGLAGSNFNAMAMEPVGHVAGIASSIQGFLSTIGGATIGLIIGQQFSGSTVPLVAGFLVCGCLCLITVTITEKGRLFRAHHHPAPAAQ